MNQNILFITADQFRADAMGFQGVFPVRTPNLDALAAGGTVFEQAYTPNPLCMPARASIMTGMHSFQHGVYIGGSNSWGDDVETLPGALAANGYYTIQIGKTHFSPKRRHGGFTKNITPEDRLRKKKPDPNWDKMVVSHYSREWDGSNEPEDYEPVFSTTRALQELDLLVSRRQCTGEADEPFFMWLSFLRPHSPCAPPPPYDTMYKPEDIPPPVKTEEEKEHFARPLREFAKGWKEITPEITEKFRPRYFGDVTCVDDQIGRMIEGLERLGLRENTLIVFSSDHGDYLGDHHQFQKAYFHDASSKVPFIFNGPRVEKGRRVNSSVSLCDLKPTLLDYCMLLNPSTRDASGRKINDHTACDDTLSLLPALGGAELPANRVIISESAIYGQSIMAKRNHEKYNYYPQTNEFDYFDLEADPNELDNRGRGLTLDTVPGWARETFQKILRHSGPLKDSSFAYEDKILPLFT